MSRAVHEFRDPARFVVGTVGQPGERVFFVQATESGRTITVRCEKQQAKILSDRLGDLLDEIAAKSDIPVPPAGGVVDDLDPLEMPVDPEFNVGTMSLGWDGEKGQVVVELLAPCVSSSPRSARGSSSCEATRWSPRAGSRARCAGSPSTRPATCASGSTATARAATRR